MFLINFTKSQVRTEYQSDWDTGDDIQVLKDSSNWDFVMCWKYDVDPSVMFGLPHKNINLQ